MNKLFTILLLSLLTLSSFGQNLIPNGDFELGPDSSSIAWQDGIDSVCVIAGSVLGPDLWIVTSGSPDRLVEGNLCVTLDNDTAQSGDAYILVGTFGPGIPEAGKTTLFSPLQQDSLYRLTYYFDLQGGCGADSAKLAFRFNNGGDSILSPIITTHGWQFYDTLFTASANSTEIEIIGVGKAFSCANIDNIALEKITQTSSTEIHNEHTELSIYPNPTSTLITIESTHGRSGKITILDLFGKKLIQSTYNGRKIFNLSNFAAGTYIIIIEVEHYILTEKLIITN